MKKLTYQDIVKKHDELKARKEKKTIDIECDILSGYLTAEVLNTDELSKCIEYMEGGTFEQAFHGICQMIYLSIPDLQNNELLEAFKSKTGEDLVGKIFTKNEVLQIGYLLKELNGIGSMDANSIRIHIIDEELKN